MASGQTHARVAKTTLILGSTAGALICARYPALWVAYWPVVGGLVNGWLVTPDIDVDHITKEEQRWGDVPVVGGLLKTVFATFWYPYALNVPHRGISHAWLLGTFTRFVYQFAGLLALWFLWRAVVAVYGGKPQVEPDWAAFPWALTSYYFVGWALQDTLHLVFDWRGFRKVHRLGGVLWRVLGILLLTATLYLLFRAP